MNPDVWDTSGPRIDSPEQLARIQAVLEEGPVIVEWRRYRGASSPDRLIFTEFDEFRIWLEQVRPGDHIWVWDYSALCRDGNSVARGKRPDASGRTPAGGAY
jgi:hypothetical protein